MRLLETQRRLGISTAILAALFSAVARADSDIDAKAREVSRSLVSVEYTIHNENISREESTQGIVIHKDGIILIAGSSLPETLPKEWIKDLKIRLPSLNFNSISVTLLGRTQDRQFAFLKAEKPIDAPVFLPGDAIGTTLGQEVFSISLLGKSSGYPVCVGRARVKALLDLMHPLANTDSFGLTCGTSPVFDFQSGKFVGITAPSVGEAMLLRDPGGRGSQPIVLLDPDQSSAFMPAEQINSVFRNIPTAPFQTPRAWLAVDGLTGISEDIRSLREIKQPAGVMIGSVIAGEAADKAGVQPQDIILTIDGKPFSSNPVPEIMVEHFARTLEKHHPGDKISLGVLRDGKTINLSATLGTSPKLASEQPHVFSPKVGVATRDLVFFDAYARRLPQDTKGVMIALVKNGAPAALGTTPLHVGDLVTKVNDEPVDNQEQFLAAMKKIDAAPDQKEAVFVVIQSDGNTQVCHVDLTK